MIFEQPPEISNPSWDIVLAPVNASYREWLQELWAVYEPYAPPNFKHDIENNPDKLDALTWEMVLAKTLLDNGFTLEPSDTDDRPDLCIIQNGKPIWIECALPTRGNPDHPDSIPELRFDGSAQGVPVKENVLRCTNTLSAKKRQHIKWIEQGVCGGDEPFIIAMHGLNLDLRIHDTMMPGIFRALYGMGDMFATFNVGPEAEEAGEEAGSGYHQTLNVEKNNGSPVPTTFLLNDENTHISGVLYSKDWGPFYGSTSPKYCFAENPYADNPTDLSFAGFAQTYEYEPDKIHLNA